MINGKEYFSIGRGTPVVLLHSSMSTKLQWFKLMQKMKTDYLMMTFDLYGYGEAPQPDDPEHFSLKHETQRVDTALTGILPPDQPFHLIGHSYGGAVAMRLCRQLKERVISMTLFEPVAFYLLGKDSSELEQSRRLSDNVARLVAQKKYAEAAQYFIDYWNGDGAFAAFPDEVRDMFLRSAKKLPLDFQALFNETLTLDDYTALDVPVCLMAGRQSPKHSKLISELLKDKLPDCRFHWVDGGHMAPVTQVQTVNRIIEEFIKSASGGQEPFLRKKVPAPPKTFA